jgi:hypothetical protein
VAQHHSAALRPAERLDALQTLGEVGTADQVQARQGDAGRGRVDVGVDERGRDQPAPEVDDGVDTIHEPVGRVLCAEPGDRVILHDHGGRTGRGVGEQVAVAVERSRHGATLLSNIRRTPGSARKRSKA